jgi:hypothetical protein
LKVPEPKKLPSGSWRVQLYVNGQRISITRPTARECKTEAALLKAEVAAGKKIALASGRDLTLSQAIDRYINSKSNTLSPSTIAGYEYIKSHRFQSVANVKLCDIKNWQRVCDAEARLCSAKTVKNAWGLVSSVLRENGIDAPKITLPQIVPNERPWLNPDEITVFVKAIKGTPCEIGALLALHGLRRSEILALTECMLIGGWSDNYTMHKIYTHLAKSDIDKYSDVMKNFYSENENDLS